MPPSPALKLFNKFHGWTHHSTPIRLELPRAQDEFFGPGFKIAPGEESSAAALFKDWFLFDRPLVSVNKTPLAFFLAERGASLIKEDRLACEAFRDRHVFGLFAAVEIHPGQGILLRAVVGSGDYQVLDENASRSTEEGDILIARLVPFADHWAFPSFVVGWPKGQTPFLDALAGGEKSALAKQRVLPRDILPFFRDTPDWKTLGVDVIKARLSAVLQRWGVDVPDVSAIEAAFKAAQAAKASLPREFRSVLDKAPTPDDAEQAQELMKALWNRLLPVPKDGGTNAKGPIEKSLMNLFMDIVQEEVGKSRLPLHKVIARLQTTAFTEWIDTPFPQLDGRTPRHAILDERKSLGNSEERIGFTLDAGALTAEFPAWKKGGELANRAQTLLLEGKAGESAKLYEEAIPLLKGHQELHRILGNLANARVMMGERDGAVAALEAALRADPDYRVARDNLHCLETMTETDFRDALKKGVFHKAVMQGKPPKARRPRA